MAETLQLTSLRQALRRRFGFRSLLEGQEEVIRAVMAGRDTLAILPTGGGKSLCYQLPGSQMQGMTVVVSPLISLMKDQVDKLDELGMAAAQVNSTLSTREESAVLAEIARERRDFVFVTPERLSQPELLAMLRGKRIDLLVVDEAHCLSEWGHDFRPAYLNLRQAIAALGDPPVLALTATATDRVIDDIRHQLGRDQMEVVATSIYRENLRFEVLPTPDEESKRERLGRLLAEIDGTGIVYVSTVRDCLAVTELLTRLGHAVAPYHGRLGARARTENQDRFMAGELKAIVATSAFGMGIDKPDLRFVIHHNLPGSLEAYYQEAGRAGRDGEGARCVLLYQRRDRNTQLFFLNGRYPKVEHFAAVYEALRRLAADHEPVPFAALQAQVPAIATAKVRVVLAMLENYQLVAEPAARNLRLVRPDLGAEELAEMARQYRRRSEHDHDRLRRMELYAQTLFCRWKVLLDYFGEELGAERCGHCDNCSRPPAQPRPIPPEQATAQRPPVAASGAPAPRPLPPLLGAHDLAALVPGEMLTLPIYGRGEVKEVSAGRLLLEFADGETREFRHS